MKYIFSICDCGAMFQQESSVVTKDWVVELTWCIVCRPGTIAGTKEQDRVLFFSRPAIAPEHI